jgi:hypothetical protein
MASERLEEVLGILNDENSLISPHLKILTFGSGCSLFVAESLLKEVGVDAAEARRLQLRAAIDPKRVAFSFFGAARGVLQVFPFEDASNHPPSTTSNSRQTSS